MSKHITENAAALVALAFDTSEPADCIKAIRKLFTLGGGVKPKLDTWQPTAAQLKGYEVVDTARRALLADDRNLLGVLLSWRHTAELRESQEMTGVALCRYCYVEPEQKRIDHSIPDNELIVTVEAVPVQAKPIVEQVCCCGHNRSHHVAAGQGECYSCSRSEGLHCDLFSDRDEVEQVKADARKHLPSVSPRF